MEVQTRGDLHCSIEMVGLQLL